MHLTTQHDCAVISLDGQWAYILDYADIGEQGQWYLSWDEKQQGQVTLPGTLTTNQVGEVEVWSDLMDADTIRSLRQRYRYVGVAWYQHHVKLPDDWEGKRMTLHLERVMWESSLWVNGQLAGRQDSLSTPHEFDITNLVTAGESNSIILRIDNRDMHQLGTSPSAYTDETQTIWNGMIGKLEIRAQERIFIRHVQLFPDVDNRQLTVMGVLENEWDTMAEVELNIEASIKQGARPHQIPSSMYSYVVPPLTGLSFVINYDMGMDALLWDEFVPNLYNLRLTLQANDGEKIMSSEQHYTFGMRSFRQVGKHLEVNGRRVFLRGTLECCIFPLTGHPPMELASWVSLLQTIKDYGLNHIRFHSWCPPKAAFDAADQLGIYVQAEAPMWMDTWNMPVGEHTEHYEYLPLEARRLLNAYGNHPSFCVYSNGNELNGDFALLRRIVNELKATDQRRVYTLTTNWDRPVDGTDDIFIAQSVDGIGARGQYFLTELTESTELDFQAATALRDVPVITHEIGQYAVYPDVTEIGRYTGALRPVNLEVIQADLERKGLIGDVQKWVRGSGMLALQLYRDEIEAALRTPDLGGFQLLDLHDFPGQSTATVGILNAFWQSKGLIEPELFRRFCGPVVLLLRMPKRIYSDREVFEAQVEIAQFGPCELPAADIHWLLKNESDHVLDQGSIPCGSIPIGAGIPLGKFTTDAVRKITENTRLTVSVQWGNSDVMNEWPIWIYKEEDKDKDKDKDKEEENSLLYSTDGNVSDSGRIHVTTVLSSEAVERLKAGQKVLFLASDSGLKNAVPGKFHPVFWSPVHFTTDHPCGVYIEKHHPSLQSFPSREYAEHPWRDLLDRSVSIAFEEPYPFNPIVQVIPNFYHNRRLANLFEYQVGKGSLLVCGMDLQHQLADRTVARALRDSLMAYMESHAFQPSTSITLEALQKLLAVQE
ncbi:glycoside hydrolase family 2 [Paenibacillus massiliensis]|uniref:glycoside hydrolase family 2 n=1 Tax=Paenibacillus massiliensis TaxID=225917 RepID=UPI00037B8B4A|nr:glycoside hydrolase family 2 [Paenibacillus massiliensis]